MVMLHLGALPLVSVRQQTSLWHRLVPQTRLVCAVLFVFATALMPHGYWKTWLVYGVGLLGLIVLSRVALGILCKRVAVEFVFISIVLLGTLFQPGGEIVFQWGGIQITTAGLTVLGSVTLRALLSLLMLNLLILTTPIPLLLQALVQLKMPPLLVAILASMYRYISVLRDEFTAMQRAAAARNLLHQRRWYRQVIGNMMGSLFIRTYERGERIHQAMLARGFTGLLPGETIVYPKAIDRLALGLMGGFLLLGFIVSQG